MGKESGSSPHPRLSSKSSCCECSGGGGRLVA